MVYVVLQNASTKEVRPVPAKPVRNDTTTLGSGKNTMNSNQLSESTGVNLLKRSHHHGHSKRTVVSTKNSLLLPCQFSELSVLFCAFRDRLLYEEMRPDVESLLGYHRVCRWRC